jgi:hypothetical protein
VKTLGRHPSRDAAFAASPSQVIDLRLSHSSLMSLAPAECVFLSGANDCIEAGEHGVLLNTGAGAASDHLRRYRGARLCLRPVIGPAAAP